MMENESKSPECFLHPSLIAASNAIMKGPYEKMVNDFKERTFMSEESKMPEQLINPENNDSKMPEGFKRLLWQRDGLIERDCPSSAATLTEAAELLREMAEALERLEPYVGEPISKTHFKNILKKWESWK